jgi:hypothetical protein
MLDVYMVGSQIEVAKAQSKATVMETKRTKDSEKDDLYRNKHGEAPLESTQ